MRSFASELGTDSRRHSSVRPTCLASWKARAQTAPDTWGRSIAAHRSQTDRPSAPWSRSPSAIAPTIHLSRTAVRVVTRRPQNDPHLWKTSVDRPRPRGNRVGAEAPGTATAGSSGSSSRTPWRSATDGVGATYHRLARPANGDRKSTRLNSSHVKISYAVFCLKKKKKKRAERAPT